VAVGVEGAGIAGFGCSRLVDHDGLLQPDV
jgi:hypothetical protein